MLLAADIGGTNARFGLFDRDRAQRGVEIFPTADWDGAVEAAHEFLRRHPAEPTSACFAVAGPVQDGHSSPVNLRWTVDSRELSAALGGIPVAVVNDLEANARGGAVLGEDDLAVVNPGANGNGHARAVVSAGTGLGEAALIWDGARYRAIPGEGGHTDFAPRTEVEVELYRFLAAEFGHVSYERICSGSGLVNVYRFLGGPAVSPAEVVADAADRRSLGSRALDLFASIYGARAGNVALSFMATGGVYLGGGIAPRIVDRLTDGGFMRAFTAKGRLSSLLEQIPVRIVLNDRAALLGAAEIAAEA
jgi:glucokinase